MLDFFDTLVLLHMLLISSKSDKDYSLQKEKWKLTLYYILMDLKNAMPRFNRNIFIIEFQCIILFCYFSQFSEKFKKIEKGLP